MNVWQATRQVRYLLEQRKWEDGGSNERVFADVVITSPEMRIPALVDHRLPLAIITPLGSSADQELPGLLMQTIEIEVAVAVAGDDIAETAVIGGSRAGGNTSSDGRGILEVEEELLAVIRQPSGAVGLRFQAISLLNTEIVANTDNGYIASRKYQMRVPLTDARFYHPCVNLTATDAGGGSVSLAWKLPATRFDTLGLVLRRASGSTPPAGPTDGTGVTVGANDTSVSDPAGSGTFSYSLFRSYAEFNGTTVDRYSAAVSRAGVVVA